MKRGNIIKVIAAVSVLALIPATDASAETVSMGNKSLYFFNTPLGSASGLIYLSGSKLNIKISYVDRRKDRFPIYVKAYFYEYRPGGVLNRLGPVRSSASVGTFGKKTSVTFSQKPSNAGSFQANYQVCVSIPGPDQCTFIHSWTNFKFPV